MDLLQIYPYTFHVKQANYCKKYFRRIRVLTMDYFVKCTGPNSAVCIKCGSKLILSKDHTIGHCGNCGCTMHVEFVEKVIVKEDPPKKKEWEQMKLF